MRAEQKRELFTSYVVLGLLVLAIGVITAVYNESSLKFNMHIDRIVYHGAIIPEVPPPLNGDDTNHTQDSNNTIHDNTTDVNNNDNPINPDDSNKGQDETTLLDNFQLLTTY